MSPKLLIDCLTYHGLFDNISMVNDQELASQIAVIDPTNVHLYYEKENYILWSIQGWIQHCKRLKGIDEKLTEHRLTHPIVKTFSKGLLGLIERLEDAKERNDIAAINKYETIINELKS